MWVDSWRPANPIFPSLCLPSSSHLISPRLCCLPSTHRRLVFNHVLPSLLTLPAQHKQRVQHCCLHCVCVCVCVCLFVLVGLGLLFQLLGQSSRLLRTSETSSLNYAGTFFYPFFRTSHKYTFLLFKHTNTNILLGNQPSDISFIVFSTRLSDAKCSHLRLLTANWSLLRLNNFA